MYGKLSAMNKNDKKYQAYDIKNHRCFLIIMIQSIIYEGRYSPKDAYGKRMARNIYAPTKEECEEKLSILIKEMKAEIAEQKAKLKNAQ